LLLADDMGFSDLACYGGEIKTPNLDHLAAGGLRLTQFYNTARCCPTRASLLTGLYPHQAGIGHMMEDRGLDGYRGDLNSRCLTIAEGLKPSGYRTYAAGKWHVTRHVKADGPKDNWPLQRGFDRFYGTIHGAGSFPGEVCFQDMARDREGWASGCWTDLVGGVGSLSCVCPSRTDWKPAPRSRPDSAIGLGQGS
jgi:arylsulfatase A-like enzyme